MKVRSNSNSAPPPPPNPDNYSCWKSDREWEICKILCNGQGGGGVCKDNSGCYWFTDLHAKYLPTVCEPYPIACNGELVKNCNDKKDKKTCNESYIQGSEKSYKEFGNSIGTQCFWSVPGDGIGICKKASDVVIPVKVQARDHMRGARGEVCIIPTPKCIKNNTQADCYPGEEGVDKRSQVCCDKGLCVNKDGSKQQQQCTRKDNCKCLPPPIKEGEPCFPKWPDYPFCATGLICSNDTGTKRGTNCQKDDKCICKQNI